MSRASNSTPDNDSIRLKRAHAAYEEDEVLRILNVNTTLPTYEDIAFLDEPIPLRRIRDLWESPEKPSVTEIAAELHLSVPTVYKYLRSLRLVKQLVRPLTTESRGFKRG